MQNISRDGDYSGLVTISKTLELANFYVCSMNYWTILGRLD